MLRLFYRSSKSLVYLREFQECFENSRHLSMNRFKQNLSLKYRAMGYENFGELYNYLALHKKDELVYTDQFNGVQLLLHYEDSTYNWLIIKEA